MAVLFHKKKKKKKTETILFHYKIIQMPQNGRIVGKMSSFSLDHKLVGERGQEEETEQMCKK